MKKTGKSIVVGDIFGTWIVKNIDKNNVKDKYRILCKCNCGRTEKLIRSDMLIDGTSTQCLKCKADSQTMTTKEYTECLKLKDTNVKLKEGSVYINRVTPIVHICPVCGEDYLATPNKLLSKFPPKSCKKCANKKRELTHSEYLQKLNKKEIPIKLKESEIYSGYSTPILHICPICGEDWLVRPNSTLKKCRYMCYKCSINKKESLMANILKQVIKYNYPNAEPEVDLGFRGVKGGISRYDQYIPEINTVCEFQSEYHDNEKQKANDKKKKAYILNHKNNYKYIAIDHRDYTILGAIQFFFPDIKEIPDYIDFSAYNNISEIMLEEIQKLLNLKKYNYKEIAEIVGNGCYDIDIAFAVSSGKLIRPKYKVVKNQSIRMKTIVQLNIDGSFVQEYEKEKIIIGHSRSILLNVCRGTYNKGKNGHMFKDYLWYYKSDYEKIICKTNNRPNIIIEKYNIVQLSLNGKLLNEYVKANLVEGFSEVAIGRACKGRYGKSGHKYKDFLWHYKLDYIEMITNSME